MVVEAIGNPSDSHLDVHGVGSSDELEEKAREEKTAALRAC